MAAVQRGTFRSDLYYRLNVITVTLPPLRERGDDVILLARHFLHHFNPDETVPAAGNPESALVPLVRRRLAKMRQSIETAVGRGRGQAPEPRIHMTASIKTFS